MKINELATLAGVSTRTLRYYDKIGLLHPSSFTEAGYRVYDEFDVDKLQNILFYKELGYELAKINKLINSKSFNLLTSLNDHLEELMIKKDKINRLVDLVIDTIEHKERNEIMNNDKKFEAFKEQQLKDNNEKYGDELLKKYDQESIDQVNMNYKKKSKYQYEQQEKLNLELNEAIRSAVIEGKSNSEKSMKMCELHQEWIKYYWPVYNKDNHLNLVKMYTEDERFTAYYDKIIPGAAVFLYKAMQLYLEK